MMHCLRQIRNCAKKKRRIVVKRFAGILAVALFLGLVALAQAPQESGWVPLFNGKDLSGWKKNGDEKWVVEQVVSRRRASVMLYER